MQTLMPVRSTHFFGAPLWPGCPNARNPAASGRQSSSTFHSFTERETDMSMKTLTALVLSAFAVMSAQAASHAGAAPAKADAAKPAASAAKKEMKKEEKKADMKKDEKKADMKKEEPKK
jgi:hypothetical protein